MNISQESLINQIADSEDINAATVRQVLKSAEQIVFDCLSSIAPSEDVTIKIFHGFSIKRTFIQRKHYSRGMFQNIDCPEHVNVKACSSKYYNGQINQTLFGSDPTTALSLTR